MVNTVVISEIRKNWEIQIHLNIAACVLKINNTLHIDNHRIFRFVFYLCRCAVPQKLTNALAAAPRR
jgi:hypothetical protein